MPKITSTVHSLTDLGERLKEQMSERGWGGTQEALGSA